MSTLDHSHLATSIMTIKLPLGLGHVVAVDDGLASYKASEGVWVALGVTLATLVATLPLWLGCVRLLLTGDYSPELFQFAIYDVLEDAPLVDKVLDFRECFTA